METNTTPAREHAALGQKYAYATVSLVLGAASFVNLLGIEKGILAIAFGMLALKGLFTVALVYVGARLAIRHERGTAN